MFTLFLIGTAAFGYNVSGRIVDSSGTGVSGATVHIDCYPDACSVSTTSGALGAYSGGWVGKNCKGDTIVVKASKSGKYGSRTWTAQYNIETAKKVTIRQPQPITGATAIHFEAEPCTYQTVGEVKLVPCRAYLQLWASPILVNGCTEATVYYSPDTMQCAGVSGSSQFNIVGTPYIDNGSGTVIVDVESASGTPVPIEHGDNPVALFNLDMEAMPFETPGQITTIDVNSAIIELDGGDYNSPISSQAEVIIGETSEEKKHFTIDTETQWNEALAEGNVYPMEPTGWEDYMNQWEEFLEEGEPYPEDEFTPAAPPTGDLYVYGGGSGGPNDPCDAGLVMRWGDETTPDGNYCSAWEYDYLVDPDLSNCTITLMVTAPQFGANGQINQVSFGLQNAPNPGGPIRAWYWNCGAPGSGAPVIWNTPTILKIDTSKVGVAAATPVANGYMNNPGFNIKKVQWMTVDENGTWIGGGSPAPAPGGVAGLWNYWHWMMVSPNTAVQKGIYLKWDQPPVVLDTNDPPVFQGWDEYSDYYYDANIVADDWNCKDDRPITDVHWWGSYLGWNEPVPPQLPQSFHLGIWTDVPDPNENNPDTFSHPGELIWEHDCNDYVWNFAGYDWDPRQGEYDPCEPYYPMEACFQFTQLLPQDAWFYQEPLEDDPNGRIYWLSIAPKWDDEPAYKWGWKTRPHFFQDDAVIIQDATIWPPVIGSQWSGGVPIKFPPYPDPEGITFDVAFQLTTFEPPEKGSADLNYDETVNFTDLAIFAEQWLTTGF